MRTVCGEEASWVQLAAGEQRMCSAAGPATTPHTHSLELCQQQLLT